MRVLGFLRHATTDWNEQGRMQGRRDVPLNAVGREEVSQWRLPSGISEGALWLSSPLRRAVETAELLGVKATVEPALTEMDWGSFEGYSLPELRARWGDEFLDNERRGLDFRPPHGESPRDVAARLRCWIETLDAGGPPIIGITHKGVLRALLALATGWQMFDKPPLKLRAAMLHRFTLDEDRRIAVDACNIPLRHERSARVR